MQIGAELIEKIAAQVIQELARSQTAGGKSASAGTVAPGHKLTLIEKGPSLPGTTQNEVVVGLAPAFYNKFTETIIGIPHDEVLRETQMIDGGHEYKSCVTSVFINADKSLVKQATRILIDNAIKYTPPGKRITISVSSAAGYARLTVQDEGIGIAPEAVPRIFDRFFRADESRAKATGGAGLGLSIAKWITERHGGHIEVLSRLEIGTRITIVLPTATEASFTEITGELPLSSL